MNVWAIILLPPFFETSRESRERIISSLKTQNDYCECLHSSFSIPVLVEIISLNDCIIINAVVVVVFVAGIISNLILFHIMMELLYNFTSYQLVKT